MPTQRRWSVTSTKNMRSGDRVLVSGMMTMLGSNELVTFLDPFITHLMKRMVEGGYVFENTTSWKSAGLRLFITVLSGAVMWLHMRLIRNSDSEDDVAAEPIFEPRQVLGIGGRPIGKDGES